MSISRAKGLIPKPGDSLLGQLILAKLVNKLPRFYKIQWIIAKKTAFEGIRNTTKPGSLRSPRGNNTDVEISDYLIDVVEVSGFFSVDVLVFRVFTMGVDQVKVF